MNTNRNDLWWVQDHRNRRISFWHQRPTQSLVEERECAILRHQWDEVPLSMTKVPEEEMLKILTNTALRLRGIEPSRDIVPPGRRCREENRPLMLDWNGSFACVKQGTNKSVPATKTGLFKGLQVAMEIPEENLEKRQWRGCKQSQTSSSLCSLHLERSVLARRFVQLLARLWQNRKGKRFLSRSLSTEKRRNAQRWLGKERPQRKDPKVPVRQWSQTSRYATMKKRAMPQIIRMRSGAPTRMLPRQIPWWLHMGEKWVFCAHTQRRWWQKTTEW